MRQLVSTIDGRGQVKILLVLNNPNREISIMEAIKKEILLINPNADVVIREMCAPGFNKYVLKYKPNVILTFPFTCIGFSTWYYLFKVLYKTKIISLRAEGVINVNQENIRLFTGFDTYGRCLVDYEIFWAPKIADIVGRNLLNQKKISSLERIRSFGYSRLEPYFAGNDSLANSLLPSRIYNVIKKYFRDDIILFVTGFSYANYSKQNLIDAKDLNAESRIEQLLEEVEFTKRYRQSWIDNISKTAKENHDALIVVKKHPTERREDYAQIEHLDNILYIYEDIDINYIMQHAGLFIHYGSTSLVDAYLSKIPSVYAYHEASSGWYSDLGWPSTRRISVNKIPEVVKEHLSNKISFSMTPEIRQILKDNFNIEEGKPYTPSKYIAQIILDKEPAQKIPLTDIYLWKSLAFVCMQWTVQAIGMIIKKVLRMDPNEPLIKRKCS